MPTKAENPAPNKLSASPVAYWLVLSQITSSAENQPPARACTACRPQSPGTSLPVCTTVAKAGDGGAQHHALGTQVDDAGFFIDQQAQRSQRQHGAGVERGGDRAARRHPWSVSR